MNREEVHQKFNRFGEIIETFPDWCEKHASWGVAVISIIYLLITCWIASQRMLWNDELFTLYISRLDNLSNILGALSTGADQHPPSFYFFTHFVLKFLGESHLAIRLPEVFGILLMSVCLFRLVSKRLSALYGFVAMLFPLITTAYEYAYEARGYALMLGFSTLAFLCWQEATERPRRIWWLVGLAVSGAAGISSHYYSVLLLIPLGAGEIVRSFERKHIDFPVWFSLVGMLVPIVLFLPVIEGARSYTTHFWSPPEWSMIPIFYYVLLIPTLGPILGTLMFSSLWPISGNSPRQLPILPPFSWHEIVAALGFVAVPVVGVVLGKLLTGGFTWRYGLSAVIGFSVLCPLAIQRLNWGREVSGVCFLVFTCIWFLVLGTTHLKQQATMTTEWSKTYEFLQTAGDPSLPIVAGDLHTFMTLARYAPPAISSRVVYLADPNASLHYLGHDTVDRGILDLKPWFHVSVEEYIPYISSNDRFLVYTRINGPWNLNWLLYDLPNAPVQIELVGHGDDSLLFLVTSNGHP